ncbi:MAG: glycosyltransferase family 2 protein [Rhodobacteraceae bacterium]|nr:glycosyltransferase family 2 protein [Paracoccaceae bacterium]MCW9043265.1 glycosyltransferase family 2 protein [Pseudopelagicola sp.]
MGLPTWATVTTAAEPTALLLAFVAHHIEVGASEIFIYLDRTNPEFEDIVAAYDQVKVFHADAKGWRVLHGGVRRPKGIVRRQYANARDAQVKTTADWLFHVDIDEFIVNTPLLQKFLSRLPRRVWSTTLPVAERVFEGEDTSETVFGGVFRTRISTAEAANLVEAVYGESAAYLKKGLCGHNLGKAGVRVGSPAQLRLHTVDLPEGESERKRKRRFTEVGLLHFDAWSYEGWLAKVQRLGRANIGSDQRGAMVKAVLQESPERPPREIFRQLYELSPDQSRQLEKAGHLYLYDFQIADKIRRVFPGVEVDLSKAAIMRDFAGLR